MQTKGSGLYEDLREAVRALCADFPAAYHRKIDEARGYPEEFVDALTKAGWMAALIPEEYGGSGLDAVMGQRLASRHFGWLSLRMMVLERGPRDRPQAS